MMPLQLLAGTPVERAPARGQERGLGNVLGQCVLEGIDDLLAAGGLKRNSMRRGTG
jgi:hypothetical protein